MWATCRLLTWAANSSHFHELLNASPYPLPPSDTGEVALIRNTAGTQRGIVRAGQIGAS